MKWRLHIVFIYIIMTYIKYVLSSNIIKQVCYYILLDIIRYRNRDWNSNNWLSSSHCLLPPENLNSNHSCHLYSIDNWFVEFLRQSLRHYQVQQSPAHLRYLQLIDDQSLESRQICFANILNIIVSVPGNTLVRNLSISGKSHNTKYKDNKISCEIIFWKEDNNILKTKSPENNYTSMLFSLCIAVYKKITLKTIDL